MIRRLAPVIGLYLILAFTFWLYYPGLSGDFLLDDYPNLRQLQDLETGMTTWQDVVLNNNSGILGRPISMLSFIPDQLAGGGLARPFKYTNLMIHLLCGVLVFWLAARLLQQTEIHKQRWWLALWISTMWLITPMQISTVLYIVQRMAQLSTLFMLAGLVSYVIGRQRLEHSPRSGITLILSSYAIFLPLALFSKENGALLPLMILVVETFLFRFQARPSIRRFLVVLFGISVAVPALLFFILVAYRPEFVTADYLHQGFTLGERLLSESRILFTYIRALLVPDSTVLGLFHDDFVKSTGLLKPWTTLLSLAGWLTVMVMMIRHFNSRWTPVLFGIAFYLAGHALESSIFPLELYFEHRNYLPSFGIFFGIAVLFGLALLTWPQRRYPIITFMILLSMAHAIASYPHISIWRDSKTLYLATLHNHPDSPRAHGEVATLYANAGNYRMAIRHYQRAAELEPRYAANVAIFKILAACITRSPVDQDIYSELKRSLKVRGLKFPFTPLRALRRITSRYHCKGYDAQQLTGILDDWLKTLDLNRYRGQTWMMRIIIAQMLYDSGHHEQALKQLDQSMTLDRSRIEPGLLKIRYLLDKNRLRAAKTLVDRLKRVRIKRRDLGMILEGYDKYIQRLERTREKQGKQPVYDR